MSSAAHTGRQAALPRLPWWIPPPVVLGVLYGAYTLRVRATVACDIGVNAGAASFGLVILLPLCAFGAVAAAEVARRLLPPLSALTLVGVIVAVTGIGVLAVSGPPPDYPSTVATCMNNIPYWWPTWLPT